MSDPTTPVIADSGAKPAGDKAPDEWKPEPRQWTWKDVFTAPMLAFKPKCMLISAITVILLALWFKLFAELPEGWPRWVMSALDYAWGMVALTIFSLAATLVAVFMKADLLDDEFLSLGEALTQYKKRIVPALLVPLFLTGLLAGFKLLLAGAELVGSIPMAGPTIYAILYPLGYLLALFVVLLGIAVVLSVFVFPSIIAIRKHGWFDNVVDTFEAVGTKPHILVGSLALTVVLITVSAWIGFGGMRQLTETSKTMPGEALKETERQAALTHDKVLSKITMDANAPSADLFRPLIGYMASQVAFAEPPTRVFWTSEGATPEPSSYYKWTGGATGIWQIIIGAFVLGYCLNLFIGGGMLTYLVVREDDYWDDEDLEDLDQLAKELEEEAKQEAAKESAGAPANSMTAHTVPPSAPPPPPPPPPAAAT
ncbi:MAG: hypothetical protein H0W72_00080 [Planctomycetes bacterium]|nr:hypothetical protein [Planctomycetota bacterium]